MLLKTTGAFGQASPRLVEPVDNAKRVTLTGNVHPLARVEFDRGAAPLDLPMNRMLLVLKHSPEQEAALRKFLDDQQDKASPRYRQWLTPEQFGQQFGLADSDIQEITAWLQGQGVAPGDRVLLATAEKLPFLVAHLGALYAGAVSLPVNPRFPREELHYVLADSGQ